MRRIKSVLLLTIGLLSIAMIAANCPTNDCSNVRLLPGGGEVCGGGGGGGGPNPTATATATPQPSTPPAATTSVYVDDLSGSAAYLLGCLRANANASGVMILAFGQPAREASVSGAYFYAPGFPFATVEEIRDFALTFASGFDACGNGAFLRLGLGTTNFDGSNNWDLAQNFLHGADWGEMVQDVQSTITQNGWGASVAAFGATDREIAWNSAANSRAWLNGFLSGGTRPLFDFGDAGGCPLSYGGPSATCAAGGNVWPIGDIWYTTWGAPRVFPIPAIYENSGAHARQWHGIATYSVQDQNSKMIFSGTLTQSQACMEVPDPDCATLDNTPSQGWQQLYFWLNTDPQTAHSPAFSTDLSYEY